MQIERRISSFSWILCRNAAYLIWRWCKTHNLLSYFAYMPPFFFVVARQMPPASINKTITVPKPKTASQTLDAKNQPNCEPPDTAVHQYYTNHSILRSNSLSHCTLSCATPQNAATNSETISQFQLLKNVTKLAHKSKWTFFVCFRTAIQTICTNFAHWN